MIDVLITRKEEEQREKQKVRIPCENTDIHREKSQVTSRQRYSYKQGMPRNADRH